MSAPLVGIAIATFNSARVVERCLRGLTDPRLRVVVFDDGSTDGTVETVLRLRPDAVILHGDGDAWWAGGTRRAVLECFAQGVDYAVMLNPDVVMSADDVGTLIEYAEAHPRTIVAPLVVQEHAPDRVAWAGSVFEKLPALPVYTNRYLHKSGAPVASIGDAPYAVDEAHGRGVVVSREVFDRIGTLDADRFPHYGADNDYSLRAKAAGIAIHVVPSVKVTLDVENTGMRSPAARPLSERARMVRNYLLERKNGEAVYVWWHLMSRHVPRHAVVPSYLFNLTLNVARRMRA